MILKILQDAKVLFIRVPVAIICCLGALSALGAPIIKNAASDLGLQAFEKSSFFVLTMGTTLLPSAGINGNKRELIPNDIQ